MTGQRPGKWGDPKKNGHRSKAPGVWNRKPTSGESVDSGAPWAGKGGKWVPERAKKEAIFFGDSRRYNMSSVDLMAVA
jgi:hypothetical protein